MDIVGARCRRLIRPIIDRLSYRLNPGDDEMSMAVAERIVPNVDDLISYRRRRMSIQRRIRR
jgi:hypothetical protein